MSFCLLEYAAKMSMGDPMEEMVGVFEELISTRSHLIELGKCLRRMQLPERKAEEIREELLRLRGRWNRVVELKIIEAGFRNVPIRSESREITFLTKEYAFHVKVIEMKNYILE